MKYLILILTLISFNLLAQETNMFQAGDAIKSDSFNMGTFSPSSNFGTGIIAASQKIIYPAHYIRIGNKVKISGIVLMRNDGTNVSITWDSLPDFGHSSISNVVGTMHSQPYWGNNGDKSLSATVGAGNKYFSFEGTNIPVSSDDHYWSYEVTYELNFN